ncbi:HAD family hydrolase [uncultured Formosa sp.]|uniref:HAD family hydrolase n=1 Tax=uncultured Formosa sp. TaxID=255435 RepID=UPI002605A2AA|nr:HAD family hydrolase [uncultured Formosa sp.]
MKITYPTLLIISTLCVLTSCKEQTKVEGATIPETPVTEVVQTDALSAWADTPKKRIKDWVTAVTAKGSSDFIPVEDRIAVFDNDGTLWPEQPVPNQAAYMFDYLKKEYPNYPEWQKDTMISAVVKGNYGPLKKAGMTGLMTIIDKTHTLQTEDDFEASVKKWIDTTMSKKYNKPYNEVVYLPMLQLLDYLKAHDFKNFIVSGGGADFMRAYAEEAYNIPPYQVIGSYGETRYEVIDGKPTITKIPGSIYVDDKAGKPQAIHRFIGKKPVFCGGNSDGDQAMMQYTSSSKYKSMCVILHHTDGEREFEYDLKTLSGHLETALVEAKEKNWMVVDMKNDFIKIFDFE